MVQFLSINFFSWISSIFAGFFKSSHFLCHPVHDEKLYDLYSLTNIIPVIKSRNVTWTRHVALMEGGEVHTWFWVGEPDGKMWLGRPRRRWEESCKNWSLRNIKGQRPIDLAQDRHGWRSCKCGNEPSPSINCGNYLTSLGPVNIPRTLLHGVG